MWSWSGAVMHHLFAGISVEPLPHSFAPVDDGEQLFEPAQLGWVSGQAPDPLPACLGAEGSDILAACAASIGVTTPGVLIDLSTSEIAW
jgi:hypothetical protein